MRINFSFQVDFLLVL